MFIYDICYTSLYVIGIIIQDFYLLYIIVAHWNTILSMYKNHKWNRNKCKSLSHYCKNIILDVLYNVFILYSSCKLQLQPLPKLYIMYTLPTQVTNYLNIYVNCKNKSVYMLSKLPTFLLINYPLDSKEGKGVIS